MQMNLYNGLLKVLSLTSFENLSIIFFDEAAEKRVLSNETFHGVHLAINLIAEGHF